MEAARPSGVCSGTASALPKLGASLRHWLADGNRKVTQLAIEREEQYVPELSKLIHCFS